MTDMPQERHVLVSSYHSCASFLFALNIHLAQHPSRTPCHGVKKKGQGRLWCFLCKSGGCVCGCGLRVCGCGLRVCGCGLRVGGCGLRVCVGGYSECYSYYENFLILILNFFVKIN